MKHKAIPALLVILLLSLVAHLMRNYKSTSTPQILTKHKLSAWVWEGTPLNTKLLDQAQKYQITTLYLDVNPAIDLLENPDKSLLHEFENQLISTSLLAKKNHISLHALMGSPGWATADKHYILTSLTAWVIDLTTRSPVFTGLHYDLEPYAIPDFSSDKKRYLSEFLATLDILIDQTKPYRQSHPDFIFGLDIPTWYESTTNNAIFSKLSRVSSSQVVLMAYRDTPQETIRISTPLVKYANSTSPQTKILIGQETQKNSEDNISYFGKSKSQLFASINEVGSFFSSYSNFSGLAIHTLPGLISLPDK